MASEHRLKRTFRLLVIAFALVLCAGVEVFAEETKKDDPLQLAPVKVTAEKRKEDLQDIPTSISVFSETQISDSGISSLQDFSLQVPNLFISNWGFRGNSFVFVRGIGAVNNDPAVGFYVDDVNYMDSRVFNSNLFDIERIEVLRGPQGTLYGRNSLGGVINIISKKPDNEYHAGVNQTFGNYGLLNTDLYMRAPIVDDKLFFGFSGNVEKKDGYNHNDFLDEDGDSQDDRSGRMHLRWVPNEKLSISANVDGEQINDGAFPIADLAQTKSNPHHYSHNFKGEHERNSVGTSVRVGYDASALQITSISGLRHYDDTVKNDQDFTAVELMNAKEQIRDNQLSQEFRFTSPKDNGDWEWLGGLYGFKNKKDHLLQMNYAAGVLGVGMPAVTEDANSDLNTYGYAAFGQATYTMFDKLDVTAGLRYDYEKSSIKYNKATDPSIPPMNLQFNSNTTGDAFLPKVQLAYNWNQQLMTYASISRGYRSGGFNTGFSSISDVSFKPEFSWNYEIGTKTSWLDNRLIFNAAAFYIKLQDQQVTQLIPSFNTIIKNAGESRSMGFELESTALITKGLTAEAGFGYTDVEYLKYNDPVAGVNYKGKKTPLAPKYTYNLALQYRRPMVEKFDMFWNEGPLYFFTRAELQGIGPFYWNDANTLKQNAYEMVNLRLGLESDHLDLTVWSKNLFNTNYQAVAFEFPGSTPKGQAGDPRTFGLTLSARF
ncbi:MAG: TonB-dependent receptor [Pseudodesulfovibrio sp.]|nr:TonB-dependent receptor [Pseudodesulfovibrio sp.]